MVGIMNKVRKTRTEVQVSYKHNGKDEPQRLNRVYDLLFSKVINKLQPKNENTHS